MLMTSAKADFMVQASRTLYSVLRAPASSFFLPPPEDLVDFNGRDKKDVNKGALKLVEQDLEPARTLSLRQFVRAFSLEAVFCLVLG
jgi:hypothetical protein